MNTQNTYLVFPQRNDVNTHCKIVCKGRSEFIDALIECELIESQDELKQLDWLIFEDGNQFDCSAFADTQASPVAIDEERYKVIDVESYETRIYTVEDRVSGDQFTITHSDSYMDPFIPEWSIVDEDCNEIIENNDLFDTLINTVLESK